MRSPNLAQYGEYIALGAQIAGSMVIPVVIGIYADNYWQSSPWGVIIGALLGFGSMISIVLRVAAKAGKNQYLQKKRQSGNEKV